MGQLSLPRVDLVVLDDHETGLALTLNLEVEDAVLAVRSVEQLDHGADGDRDVDRVFAVAVTNAGDKALVAKALVGLLTAAGPKNCIKGDVAHDVLSNFSSRCTGFGYTRGLQCSA